MIVGLILFVNFAYAVLDDGELFGDQKCKSLIEILDAIDDLTPSERSQLSKVAGKLNEFSTSENPGLSIEQSNRLDEVFVHRLRARLKELNKRQSENLEKAILRTETYIPIDFRITASVMDFRIPWRASIKINEMYVQHPTSKIVLSHEMSHLLDSIKSENLTIKSTETAAFSTQYDYIREVFSVGDLPDLRRNFPTTASQEELDLLTEVGFIKEAGGERHIDFEVLSDPQLSPKVKIAAGSFIHKEILNSFFVDMVERALNLEKPQYISTMLRPYSKKIQRDRVKRAIIYLAGAGIIVIPSSVLAYWYFSSDE